MKDIIVYVRVERYLKEWLNFHLGSPVRFPARSFENELLHRLLSKRPADVEPDLGGSGSVAVTITDCRHRRPEFYNYLGTRGQRTMAAAIDALFRLALWTGCAPLVLGHEEINRGIEKWCKDNGLSSDSFEAVRQKFYRIRKDYRSKGIVLGKIYNRKGVTKLLPYAHNQAGAANGPTI